MHLLEYPAIIYLFKLNNKNTTKRCEICSKLTIKHQKKRRSSVFIIKFEQNSGVIVDFK